MNSPPLSFFKKLLAVFLVSLLAFSPIFFRPMPFGMDSLFYLRETCEKGGFEGEPTGAKIAFSLLPCDIFLLKVVFFFACFLSAAFAMLTGSLFSKKGWLAGILVFATPIWLLEFWKFENDGLAYPILFCAAWLFYSGLQKKSLSRKILAIVLVLLAQTIWTGSVLWLIAFSLSWFWIAIITLPALAINFYDFIQKIVPTFGTTESLPGYGLLYQLFLITAIMYAKHLPLMLAPITFFTLIAFINAKFAVHASFVLSIAATKQLEKAHSTLFKYLPLIGVAVVSLFLASMIQELPPDSQELAAAEFAVSLAEGETICNDWGTGHMVRYLGGKPLAVGGGQQLCGGCKDCIVLSYREFDCKQVNETLNDTELRVYQC